jgi:hypothetical protein
MKSNDNIERANRRARELQPHALGAVSARYDRKTGRIEIHLSSKLIVSFAPEHAQGLESARPSQLNEIEISSSSFGLHFPEVDADLYVPGLLEGFPGSKSWMASRLGQIGGKATAKPGKRHPGRMANSGEDRGRCYRAD